MEKSLPFFSIGPDVTVENVLKSVKDECERMGRESKVNDASVEIIKPCSFVIPGLIDTHVHAPQFAFHGSATGIPLMDWLKFHTFPSESRLKDVNIARKLYRKLVKRMLRNGTTCALYFATIHLEASKILSDITEELGQRAFIGKISMDQNSIPEYVESTERSLLDTEEFIRYVLNKKIELVKPVVTPRFIPTCSLDLMKGLGKLANQYNVHIQSHISESDDQVSFVQFLHPNRSDTEIFDECGLLTNKTVMAHGTHLDEEDVKTLVSRGTSISSCPLSNFFFANRIFPLEENQRKGLKIGLGTDIAGGYSISSLSSIRNLVIASKALSIQKKDSSLEIDYQTGFWHATMGGAISLGIEDEVGSFAVGKRFDALLIDCSVEEENFAHGVDSFDGDSASILFEKFINCGDERNIQKVWVDGKEIL
eukprot:TRINITY_DN1218_c0_g1_i3.p1 TRINITY_DN1218_c0_g1~~TRINITY_DN1218_c0_g1_i3.p1  ORF type:complete len:424 (+),score=97.23 TRINITY_DN1218_c0_g1_i3:1478-2749(+)